METSSPPASDPLAGQPSLDVLPPPVVPPYEASAPTHGQGSRSSGSADEDSLQSTMLWLLGLSIAQKSVGFVRSIIVCRLLDPVNMGTWGMSLAVMETLLPLCLLSIPGCFGRYVEHFRHRGQLIAFVRQAAILCLSSLTVSTMVLCIFRERVATFCFGSPQYSSMLMLSISAMIPSTFFVFCSELLVAMRLGKTSTLATFCRGVSFTVLSIGLLLWRGDVFAMIAAFGISYAICLALVVPPVLKKIRHFAAGSAPLPMARTWAGLSRFLFAFWLTDFLGNMFFTVDRYMLVNLSGNDATTALSQVGNYASAHVIPILLVTVVLMIARLMLPYLVRDWEGGRRDLVRDHTHLCVKVTSLTLFVVGWAFVFVSKPIFDVWFRGQYEMGLEVVPLAVAIYSFAGLATMWMNYFLCMERAFLGTITTAAAVLINIVANLILVPKFGLMGAAWATLLANVMLIVSLIKISHHQGLRARWETSLLAMLPLAICIPFYAAASILVAIIALIAAGFLITSAERRTLTKYADEIAKKLTAALPG